MVHHWSISPSGGPSTLISHKVVFAKGWQKYIFGSDLYRTYALLNLGMKSSQSWVSLDKLGVQPGTRILLKRI